MSFTIEKFENLIYWTSDKIPFRHAFSTRLGGYGTGVCSSFNFAYRDCEEKATTDKNRELFARLFSLDPSSICSSTQIHSKTVFELNAIETPIKEELFGDGFVTSEKGLLLCVKTADCAPILLCDSEAGVIGAVHAGWRGTFDDIVGQCLEIMVKKGAKCENIHAAIGPCICKDCFEVGDELVNMLDSSLGHDFVKSFCFTINRKAHVDLKGINEKLMLLRGVKKENIDVCAECTCCNPQRYFSHRKNGNARGTMVAGITL